MILAVSLLFLLPTIGLARSGSLYRSRETGTFRDAGALAGFLRGRVGEGDRIVAVSHTRAPLEYHLRRSSVPLHHLELAYPEADRLLVVVYPPRPQTIEGVLADAGVPLEEFTVPGVMARFPETCLYVLERIEQPISSPGSDLAPSC